MRRCIPFAAASLLLATGLAHAATVTYTSNAIGLATTNWSDTLSLPQFDPSLGTLDGITVELFGEIHGNARAESLDAQPATVALTLAAELTLSRPDLTALVVSLPVTGNTFQAAAYDGTIDWGGSSGIAYLGIGATQTASFTTASAGDLALFTGTGAVLAPLTAVGLSSATGGANLASFFQTQAGAYAQVTYSFTSAVPEPGTWALMLGGLVMVGSRSVRRRS